jgi:hypothetical protein
MKITEWLPGFLVRHHSRHPRDDWPAEGTGHADRLRQAWLDSLLRLDPRPRESEADAASIAINGASLAFAEDHPPALVQAITQARARPKAPSVQPQPGSKDERYAEAAKAIAEVGAMTPEQRLEFAAKCLDQFHDLGWMMSWCSAEGQFRTLPTIPGAPPPGTWLATRLRALRAEVYAILGHPLPGSEPVPDVDGFEDLAPKARWRRMVEALGERVHAT